MQTPYFLMARRWKAFLCLLVGELTRPRRPGFKGHTIEFMIILDPYSEPLFRTPMDPFGFFVLRGCVIFFCPKKLRCFLDTRGCVIFFLSQGVLWFFCPKMLCDFFIPRGCVNFFCPKGLLHFFVLRDCVIPPEIAWFFCCPERLHDFCLSREVA